MLLLAGLGNPGAKYANNRHNVGFMAVDAIARRHSFSPWSRKFQAEIAEGRLGGEKALLLKPQTFMNLSGQAVGEALRFYKLDPSAVTVLYDEIDLAPGKIRVKIGGGAGGHNGIRSIDQHIGQNYRRVRIGVGHPGGQGRRQPLHEPGYGDAARAVAAHRSRRHASCEGTQAQGAKQGRIAEGAKPYPPGTPQTTSRENSGKRADGRHAEEAAGARLSSLKA